MTKDSSTTTRRARRPRLLAPRILAALVALTLSTLATAQVGSLYFREAEKDGRIYVFNTSDRYTTWARTGEMGTSVTLVGRGAGGETLVGENEAAIDLYLFKHNLPAYERPAAAPPPSPAPTFPQVKVGTTLYASYQDGQAGGTDYSKFVVKRAYLDVTGKATAALSFRVTPDITQDSTGDYKVRLKYGYGMLGTAKLGFVTKPFVELGMVHTPYIDFEEKINLYRMQDTVFMERIGTQASADLGIMAGGLIGGELSADAQKASSSANPGRWGSFAIGVYNGGGYNTSEANTSKAIEGRLTVRPLPDFIPGLQVTYYGIGGKGNTATEPDWTLNQGTVTYESRYLNAVGTYLTGTGNAAGTAVDSTTKEALNRKGWSVFVEGKLGTSWSVIGRYDDFTPDTRTTDVQQKRTIGGVCYHLAKGFDLLLDYDQLEYAGTTKPTDKRTQLTLGVKL
jgi:hypothetical protein